MNALHVLLLAAAAVIAVCSGMTVVRVSPGAFVLRPSERGAVPEQFALAFTGFIIMAAGISPLISGSHSLILGGIIGGLSGVIFVLCMRTPTWLHNGRLARRRLVEPTAGAIR